MRGRDENLSKLSGRSTTPGSAFAMSLLQYALGKSYGLPITEISVTHTGRPFLTGYENIHYSLSHSRGHIFCVVADWLVGADIEPVTRHVKTSLIDQLTTEGEREDFDFISLWTLRESYFKVKGGDLRTLRFSRDGGRITPPTDDVFCRLYEPNSDTVAAICSVRDCFAENIETVPAAELMR